MSSQPPSDSEAVARWFTEAEAARLTGDVDTARHNLAQVLALDPAHASAMHAHGLLALTEDRLADAQGWVERALESRADAAFFGTLCDIQSRRGAYADALQSAQRGLRLTPDCTTLLHYEARLLQTLGRPDEAVHVYFRLLELDPDHADALASLGLVLKDLGSLSEAERYLRQVIDIDSSNRRARANLGEVLLAAGEYEEGWRYFEDRLADAVEPADFASPAARPGASRVRLALPEWRGEPRPDDAPPRAGRLLVTPEAGVAESLQFARYLPMALERFTHVGYVCPAPLRRLYEESLCARWPGLVMLDDVPPDVTGWDCQCPMMSLPMAFGTRIDSIPAASYLYADPARRASWCAKLASLSPEGGAPRVGIAWTDGPAGVGADPARSLLPAQIALLLALPVVRWVSLQQNADDTRRVDAASGGLLIDCTHELADFADTAALIDNLDLVIAVDTAVAHLAAAMGKPVWLLNRFAGGWTWLRQRDDSPWYPSMRIFTQAERGEWGPVLLEVVMELQKCFGLAG